MFDANGYAGAGINEMLDSSGLSKGALYFHFESNEAIAQALIDQWRTFVDDLRHEVNSTETSALAQIVMLFREHAEAVSADLRLRAGLKLSVEQGITGSGGAYREWVDMVEALVATAIDRGELHDNDAAQRFSEASCTTFLGAITAPPLMNTSPSITVAIDDMLTGWLIGCCLQKILSAHWLPPVKRKFSPNSASSWRFRVVRVRFRLQVRGVGRPIRSRWWWAHRRTWG